MAPRDVLIVARAARQLAAAARGAGYRPLVVDMFGDEDTRAQSVANIVTPADGGWRFRARRLVADINRLPLPPGPVPLLWGAGFEGRAELLATLGARFALLGSPLAALDALADPRALARRLRLLDIPTPPIAVGRVPRSGRWLRKQRGQAGGHHVHWAAPQQALAENEYAQRFCTGRSLSVAFVAGRGQCRILGYSEHLFWADPAQPFAYAGAVGGIYLPGALRARIARSVRRLAASLGLRGLCGCDFVLGDAGRWWLVEINARPTATFDLLCPAATAFRAHLAACRGATLPALPQRAQAVGHLICRLPDAIQIPNSLNWPPWVADRPTAGARVPRGAPLCTVRASGVAPQAVLARLTQRVLTLRRMLGSDDCSVPAVLQPTPE